jgi:hypothetical protein
VWDRSSLRAPENPSLISTLASPRQSDTHDHLKEPSSLRNHEPNC